MSIGDELVYRVAKTPKGYTVHEYDGRGLAAGYCTKRSRYFYGDDAEEKAHNYARNKAGERDDARVVALGERV